jgi:hypothetical protein
MNGRKLVLFPDELGHTLEKANIEGSSFPYILNTAYYQDDIDLTMAKNKRVKLNCCLSVVGGVIDNMFGDLFGSRTTGGLHGRFIFGLGSGKSYLYRPYNTVAEKINPVAIDVSPDVWDCRDAWVKNNIGLTPRIAEHALRVAAICASFDGRTLYAKDLGPALEFARYQVRIRGILEPNPGENPDARCAFAILSWLRLYASDGRPVERREVYRAIHAERFGPGVFDRALLNLKANEGVTSGRNGSRITIMIC